MLNLHAAAGPPFLFSHQQNLNTLAVMEKMISTKVIIILGSGPNAVKFKDMAKNNIDHIIAINNAWKISSHWDEVIYPEDFPISKRPSTKIKSK